MLLDVHERACAFFQEYLRRPEGAHAREYLAGRGLNEEVIKAFRIGFAPDSGFILRDRLKGEFDEEVLRESGVFSWKAESGRQTSVVGRQQNNRSLDTARETRSLDSARDDKSDGADQARSQQPEANDRCHVLQVPQPGDVSHHQRSRARDCLYRAHSFGRREGWTQIFEFAGDCDLLQVAGAVQSRPGERGDSQAGLRHPGRRADGLHLGLCRGLPQRDRQLGHGFHRASGPAFGALYQERGGQFRSGHGWRQGHRTHSRPAGGRRISGQGADPGVGLRS